MTKDFLPSNPQQGGSRLVTHALVMTMNCPASNPHLGGEQSVMEPQPLPVMVGCPHCSLLLGGGRLVTLLAKTRTRTSPPVQLVWTLLHMWMAPTVDWQA